MQNDRGKKNVSKVVESESEDFSAKYESMMESWKQTQRTRIVNTRKNDSISLKREVVKISSGDDPLLVILVKGSYTYNIFNETNNETVTEEYPNIISISHYNKTLNNGIDCTAGFKWVQYGSNTVLVPGDDPCVGCETRRQENKAISASLRNYITLVLPGRWHLAQLKDAKGNDTEEWVSCSEHNCRLCTKGVPSQYGRRGLLIIGPSHYSSLILQKETVLSKVCSNCKGSLKVSKYICPSCKSRYALAKELTKEETKSLRLQGGYCKECQYEGFMFPIHRCSSCSDPMPLDIWGTPILLSKLGEGTTSSYSISLPSDDEALSDEEMQELSKYMTPYTKTECITQMSLDKQAEKFKMPNPYARNKGKKYAAWNDNDEDDDNKEEDSEE